jgi:mannan endo-1,4-beta-mannosidase
MKAVLALAFSLLLGVAVLPTTVAQSTTNGTRFSIDGVTKYFAGSNSYWISFLTNDKDVDTAMGNVAKSGLKILRVWGFNDVNQRSSGVYYQLLSSSGSQINTGANGLQRLDAVVKAAEKHGVKLIINFVNYWDDYGVLIQASCRES